MAAACLAWRPQGSGERAVEILARLREGAALPAGVAVRELALPGSPAVKAKLYAPSGSPHRAMVLIHGIHRRSIHDPRVIRVATELASQGVAVLTPEMADLADYRITEDSVDVIARAVKALAGMPDAAPTGKVGLVGISFGGGLALVAAARPDVGERLEHVSTIGAHHDFRRVVRFFLTNVAEGPGGSRPLRAHEYGLTVLVYGRLPALAPAADVDTLGAAFRSWLAEDREAAREHAARLTTAKGKAVFAHLEAGNLAALRPEIEADVERDAARLERLSPAGKLRAVPVPIFLLHGRSDHLIPTAELDWAVRELGEHPHQALVTSLIDHVMPDRPASVLEVLRLADVLSHWL
jgi:pimeloyl-ACP methyl ester carboxylesterase